MRILLGADPHGSGRSTAERELSVSVFEEAYTLAVANSCEEVWWLGDLLHFKYGLELRLLLDWNDIIRKNRNRGIKTRMIPGNHDKPWDNEPDRVAISLLDCNEMYTQPEFTFIGDAMVAFLPWLPPDQFKEESTKLARVALAHLGRKFLFSHTSLAEGFVSPSNFQVDSQVRLADLYPDTWDHIFLGDYHAHQKVGTKLTYLGAPIPRTFGDHNNLGYWMLDIRDNGTWYFTNLPLSKRYPKYHKYTFGFFDSPKDRPYVEGDNYRVICPAIRVPEMMQAYPGAVVKSIPGHYVIPKSVNLPEVSKWNPFSTYQSWLDLKGLESDVYYPIGEEALKKCLGHVR